MKKSLALFILFSIFVANISMGQPTPPQNTDRSGNNNNIGYGNREPIYLPEMQNGVVKIRVLVDTNGSVKEAQIVQHGTTITSQSVRQECLDVAKQAKYQPSSKEEYNFIVLKYPNGSDKNVNAQRGNNGYGPRGNGENGNGYGPREGNRNGSDYVKRRPIFIPEITIPENETVKIRVLIGVDGVVKEAEIIPQGTTINDPEMRQQCLDAAKRAKYQPSPREEYSFIVFPKGNDDNMYERQGNGYRPEEGNRNGGSYRNGAGPQDNGGN